jgi:hypothetical protein
MATTYLGGLALGQLAEAQAMIDEHIVSCARCGTNEPCAERRDAEQVFSRYGRLPRRTPGLVAAGRTDRRGFHWLDRV